MVKITKIQVDITFIIPMLIDMKSFHAGAGSWPNNKGGLGGARPSRMKMWSSPEHSKPYWYYDSFTKVSMLLHWYIDLNDNQNKNQTIKNKNPKVPIPY